ncbi:hypothetical protein [Pedobacter caeni]|uniref:Uncharacterized protein n=1 Tax=Pedobacter caeni TaxID=288992 RepID=A0A1M4W6P3_9SPHI|nr:hypothetical protein [Pedobacter caeni]SHE76869.1 hypothetical protein SAMN04488522_1011154 [Pedobacter caeni]
MNNYLTREQLKAKLNVGKAVEQWLGHYDSDDGRVLKWLRIYSQKEEYNLLYIECYDQGGVDNLDISDFTVVDPDEPYGLLDTFNTPDEVINFSLDKYGAEIDHFVNDGMIQEEYLNYLINK